MQRFFKIKNSFAQTIALPKSWGTLLLNSFDTALQSNQIQSFSRRLRFQKPQVKFNKKILGVVAVVLLAVVAYYAFGKFSLSSQNVLSSQVDQRTAAPAAKATRPINKELSIPIKNEKGTELGKIKYVVESAALQDEILVKGQLARAITGRTFLIFNIKITNPLNQGTQINTKDFIRLTLGNKTEMLAADIHNDPVQVQAISTKLTRIGFPINDSDKNITMYLGEIDGPKQIVKLSF